MILRNIYEISTLATPIHGVKFRWTIRKLCIQHDITVLLENASDKENVVRFALISTSSTLDQDIEIILSYIYQKIHDAHIHNVLSMVQNPVLSKLDINNSNRYVI